MLQVVPVTVSCMLQVVPVTFCHSITRLQLNKSLHWAVRIFNAMNLKQHKNYQWMILNTNQECVVLCLTVRKEKKYNVLER